MAGRVFLALFSLAAALAGAAREAERPAGFPPEMPWPARVVFRFQRGDDPRWAAPDFDDSRWSIIDARALPSRDGIYWLRWRLTQRHPGLASGLDGLILKMVASYDLFWDGRLIGRNGRVSAAAEDEAPGSVDALFQIPAELLGGGEHVVALRMSSFNTGFPTPTYGVIFGWGNFRSMLVQRSRTAIFSVMAVGAALIGAIVFGLMWLLAGRRLPLLLFSGLCLAAAGMQALQAWRWLFEYPYSWHYPRLVVITSLVTAMSALLAAFVMHHFEVGRRRAVYPVLAMLLTASWLGSSWYNVISLYVCTVGFVTALALSARAVWLRKRGAVFACAGLAMSLVALVLAPRDFLDHAFFISAGPAIFGLLVPVVLQLRDERRDARQAMLTAARMETELLKKNIQPHFLLNTLATIQETIEQEPRVAVALIDALAAEFRILARVSGEKLIPLGQELELCRAHLHVMSLRKAVSCRLNASGVDEHTLVPPALFHTLIENGLTHLLPTNGRLDFDLGVERVGALTRHRLRARGTHQRGADAGPIREGTGLRYIKARLEESFSGQWSVRGEPVAEGWETVIEIGGLPPPSGAGSRPAAVMAIATEKPA